MKNTFLYENTFNIREHMKADTFKNSEIVKINPVLNVHQLIRNCENMGITIPIFYNFQTLLNRKHNLKSNNTELIIDFNKVNLK